MKCILNNCERPAESRGLCHAHYQTALRWVRGRQGTWKQLERDGFASPATNNHDSAFGNALKDRYVPTAIEIATQQAAVLPGLPTSNECRQITPLPDIKVMQDSMNDYREGRVQSCQEIINEIKPIIPLDVPPWKDYDKDE